MDWRQLVIDYPAIAVLLVLPMFVLAAAIKVAITLMTGPEPSPSEDSADAGDGTHGQG